MINRRNAFKVGVGFILSAALHKIGLSREKTTHIPNSKRPKSAEIVSYTYDSAPVKSGRFGVSISNGKNSQVTYIETYNADIEGDALLIAQQMNTKYVDIYVYADEDGSDQIGILGIGYDDKIERCTAEVIR